MGAVFKAVGSLFGGGGSVASPPPPPAAPLTPAQDPAAIQAQKQAQADAEMAASQRGAASTMVAGNQTAYGLQQQKAKNAKSALLG